MTPRVKASTELVEVDIKVTALPATPAGDVKYSVTVTRNPNVPKLVSGEHEVQFTSNDPTTVIVFTKTSPFADADLPVGKQLPLGPSGKGPYKVVNKGQQNHFDCGYIDKKGNFVAWGGGGTTPT